MRWSSLVELTGDDDSATSTFFFRADARKRYTAMVPRHKGVHMNTP